MSKGTVRITVTELPGPKDGTKEEPIKAQLDTAGNTVLVYNQSRSIHYMMDKRAKGNEGDMARSIIAALKLKPLGKVYFWGFVDTNGNLVIGDDAPWQEW